MQIISGQLVDIFQRRIYPAILSIENKKIARIDPFTMEHRLSGNIEMSPNFILPGFIDAHVHIESSMLVPSEFARLAVVHGTVGTVSDPHEIANVCGIRGIEFMIENGLKVPFKFNFGAPSCVPATQYETAGAVLDSSAVASLLQRKEIRYLSEMMNFPGVLSEDPEVMKKIKAAHQVNKPVDGHAPGLKGRQAEQYIRAGISTDHECFTKDEALDKLRFGMKILIREGSAAKNFEALIDLLHDYPDQIMLCSDDKHPDSLVAGHINQLCARAVEKGIDVFNLLQAACINPVLHYKLDIGLLRETDAADFIIVENLKNFHVLKTYIDGELVFDVAGKELFNHGKQAKNPGVHNINNFNCGKKEISDFEIHIENRQLTQNIRVIEALDGQLITNSLNLAPKIAAGKLVSDPERDLLKIVVVNRYKNEPVAKAFIKNFGLKQGAIASSVAHDSHNIVAVGADDESICRAVNLVIERQGGISCTTGSRTIDGQPNHPEDFKDAVLELPVGGLMSAENGYQVAQAYTAIDSMAKNLGSQLAAPFMTLSFMALLVIPHLKLSDKGLFDGDEFRLSGLWVK